MPISKAERNKLRSHTFSEDKIDEFGGTHVVTPEVSVAETLRNSSALLRSKYSVFLLNIPSSIILAFYVFAVFGSSSLTNLFWYSVAFFVLGVAVVAPLTAIAKARISNIKVAGIGGPILMSLNYLGPLVAVAYIGLMTLVIHTISSGFVFLAVAVAVLIIAIILQVSNLNSALSVYLLYDRGLRRDTALGRSWMFMSGQSLQMLAVNIAVFLPLVIAIVLDAVLSKTSMVLYLTLLTFILADLCTSWWQACTSYVYAEVIKKAKPMRYSRL
ncbi:MAG TPA: hypothetical protein VL945_01060 [Candidatus Saccharimonadales bacterium]|nr:hypothetical protein [Candidatus Saccharimonadales bacterium]